MNRYVALIFAAVLAGCAGAPPLVPGEARVEDVRRVMGEPATIFRDADGTMHFAYPTGPLGYRTAMAHVAADGRLLAIEPNVLDTAHFAHIAPGMSKEQVLRALGPPTPERTMYFAARDELAWDWRYCDDWLTASYFSVLFDATRGTVRSTLSTREECNLAACRCAP